MLGFSFTLFGLSCPGRANPGVLCIPCLKVLKLKHCLDGESETQKKGKWCSVALDDCTTIGTLVIPALLPRLSLLTGNIKSKMGQSFGQLRLANPYCLLSAMSYEVACLLHPVGNQADKIDHVAHCYR